MVDDEVVARRLRELDRRVTALSAIKVAHEAASYLDDFPLQAQVERHLQLAVQAAIDVAAHIAAQDTAELPEDYGETFAVLGRAGIISVGLADKLRHAAGLRNVLVHGYVDVDHGIVWATLDDLDDLRDFAKAIVTYMDES